MTKRPTRLRALEPEAGPARPGRGVATASPWPESSALRTWTGKLVDRLWLKEVRGLEHLPREGACIVIAPHASYLDFFVVGTLFERHLHRKLRFWAKTKMITHPVFGPFCRATGCLEVAERGYQASLWRDSLEWLLEREEALCIFPEGTRSVSGRPGTFRPGYLKLAAEAGVPIVPLRVSNTHEIWPPGRRLPRLGAVRIDIREPRRIERSASSATLRQLNRELQAACVEPRP